MLLQAALALPARARVHASSALSKHHLKFSFMRRYNYAFDTIDWGWRLSIALGGQHPSDHSSLIGGMYACLPAWLFMETVFVQCQVI